MRKSIDLAAFILLCAAVTAGIAQTGVKQKRQLPYEYGRVIMNSLSGKVGLPAVVFDHWLHRTRYTCRLCHVDLAFAMKANGSSVRAEDNAKGYYCGACHNGKKGADGKKVFESCSVAWTRDDLLKCARCHSQNMPVKREHDFDTVTARFPLGASPARRPTCTSWWSGPPPTRPFSTTYSGTGPGATWTSAERAKTS